MCHLFTLYIKRFREAKKMTQSELGFKIGKSQGFISQIEADNISRKKSILLIDIIAIADALDVCCNDLIRFKCVDCRRFSKCTRHENLQQDDEYFKCHLEYYI
jgi:transcriptional regulator with XRE-family HTH domain